MSYMKDETELNYPKAVYHSSYSTQTPLKHSPTPTLDVSQGSLDKYEISSEQETVKGSKQGCFRRYICCGCCLPLWASSIIWFIIIGIIIVVIVIGSIAGTFVMPTVDLAGISGDVPGLSQMSIENNTVLLNLGLVVEIHNPNILDIHLSNMNATAYYPFNGERPPIGFGFLKYQFIPKKSNTTFTFPFSLRYDPEVASDRVVIDDIFDKCGLTGHTKQDLTLDYDIKYTAKVLFIKVYPTISSSTSFACPISKPLANI